jgi:hypothetical protein
MSQKSSVPQTAKSVSQALMSDTAEKKTERATASSPLSPATSKI